MPEIAGEVQVLKEFWLSERGKPTRALFCGDRNWTDWSSVEQQLLRFIPNQDTIITGGARGADTIAHKIADDMGFATEVYEAEWDKYGRAAGPKRNERMLVEGRPDVVVAFHPDLKQSKGTLNMVQQARAAGVRVVWVRESGRLEDKLRRERSEDEQELHAVLGAGVGAGSTD